MGLAETTVQDLTAIKWQSWDLNAGLSGTKVYTLSHRVLSACLVRAQGRATELSLETMGVNGVDTPQQKPTTNVLFDTWMHFRMYVPLRCLVSFFYLVNVGTRVSLPSESSRKCDV